MLIIDHILCTDGGEPVRQVASPNHSGALRAHEYLIMHYTAGVLPQSTINVFTNDQNGVSAHLLITRQGEIVQFVPFNLTAWHAGFSNWADRTNLNRYSIGIELDNFGYMHRIGDKWGRASSDHRFTDDQVVERIHKLEFQKRGWEIYAEEQIEVALEVAQLLVDHYQLVDVVGHDDVSTTGKVDPGPAFPLQSFRNKVLGLDEDEPLRYIYTTRSTLNIRLGAGTDFEPLEGSPLPTATPLVLNNKEGDWVEVDVLEEVNGIENMRGWVHQDFIEKEREFYNPKLF